MESSVARKALVLAVCLSLSGCYGLQVNGEYLHLSSIPLVNDLNTVDQVGISIQFPLAESRYATRMEIGMAYELDHKKPVVGPDPVGVLKITQPLFIWSGK